MKSRHLVLSSLAEKDLLNIYLYSLTNWGERQAILYKQLLDEAFLNLSKNPLRIGSKARNDLSQGCRILHVGKHYVVYRFDDEWLEVARILHENMDFDARMNDGLK